MPLTSPFLVQARSIEEALDARQQRPGASFIAGGTSLIPDQNLGLVRPEGYISLRRIDELSAIRLAADSIFIGAGCTANTLAGEPFRKDFPALALAARSLGTAQVRARATLGGNLAHGGADRTLLPCLLALTTTVHLASKAGREDFPIEDYLRDKAKHGPHLVTGITISRTAGFQHYTRVSPTNGAAYATAAVAAVLERDQHTIRIALGGAGHTALRAHEVEAFVSAAIDWDHLKIGASELDEAGKLAATHCDPPSDSLATAAYRRHALNVMTRRTIETLLEQAR